MPEIHYAGSEWIQQAFETELSPLGAAVADLLGDVFFGIYHLDAGALGRVKWSDPHYILVNLRHHSLATFDGDELTRLVVLCHDRCLRLDLKAIAPLTLQLLFHQRQREGGIWKRHPTIEQAVERIRSAYVGQSLES